MKIYLDACALQRPLDTPNQIRIVLEAEAVLGLIALFEAGQFELLSSDALIYETEQNPLPARQEHAMAILAKAKEHHRLSDQAKVRAAQLTELGFKPLDALHLALAESGHADYFCTCDDKLLRKAQKIADLQVKVVSPLDLVQEIEK
ncbi:MAG: nucleic acid-binding protein [Chloroflexi bacterium RBG_16_48_8]|nr:MAG: nucleic acid-binding protein [Chloroflexi bacterium RBG_16_48_8]